MDAQHSFQFSAGHSDDFGDHDRLESVTIEYNINQAPDAALRSSSASIARATARSIQATHLSALSHRFSGWIDGRHS